MKKNITLASIVLSSLFSAQTLDAINKIYPAAPTSNNLMKFEEVPVSYYTGVPDINIPIYTLSSNRIQIPVGLSYHILNTKPDDYASEVGLGWNLIAGGTISRTVKGLPDEAIKDNLGGGRQGIGIYIDEFSNHPNFTGNYRNYTATYLNMISNGGNPFIEQNFRKTAFEAAVSNRYDTQYDLYQYNFFGNTGRFIVKKNSNNAFEVIKLDKNNLKITGQYNNRYEPISFMIIDEKGKKYTFDVVEKTQRSYMVNKVSQLTNSMPQTSIGQIDDYNSSFHLSSIRNEADQELVNFQYNPAMEVNTSYTSTTSNFPVYASNYEDYIKNQIDPYLPPKSQSYTTNTLNKTRTLSRINVLGGGKMDFTYTGNDPNLGLEVVPRILSEIQIKDDYDKVLEKVSLTQQLNGTLNQLSRKRMKLTEIIRKNISNNMLSKYKLDYYSGSGTKDDWGYSKDSNGDVLRSITYPTGGKSEFNYGPNTFSYMSQNPGGTMPLIGNFGGNPNNWIVGTEGVSYTKFKESEKYMFTIKTEQDVLFNYFMSSMPATDWRLELFWGDGTISSTVPNYFIGTLWSGITSPEGTVKLHLPPGHYSARLDTDDASAMFQTFNPVSVTAGYVEYKTQDLEKFLYGGGIRVSNIRYLDSNGALLKEKSFSYQDPSDPMKSTGALAFPVPVKNYENDFYTKLWYTANNTLYESVNYNNTFKTTASDNLLPVLKTKGSDVGYEYVTIYETGKGKTINHYTSPRGYPNSEYISTEPPFLPITDEDYNRGHFIGEEVKNENDVLLREKTMDYSTQTENILTGILFRSSPQDVYLNEFDTYDDFLYYKQNCSTSFTGIKCSKIENTSDFPIQFSMDKSIISRINPTRNETKEYQSASSGGFIKTNEETTYNALNLPIKSKIVYPDNTISEISYQYANEKGNQLLIDKNMVDIPLEITTVQTIGSNTKTLSRIETVYPKIAAEIINNNSGLVLPLSVKSYDILNNAPSTEVTYNKYDAKGNILQYTSKDGIPTAIVWGYNNTQPIAKVQGATYDQLVSLGLITTIVNASDLDASDPANEPALITALDTFRKNSGLSVYQVSTYTYDPLIGVTSITPPSGIREVYIYDTANRLKEIRQDSKTGNLIKEFKYNYKN